MQYEGHAFHESLNKGKASGTLAVSREGIAFRKDEHDILFPLNGLNFELGGSNNRLIFITHPSFPDWKFYTADHNILKDPVIASSVNLQKKVSSVKKTKQTALLIGLGFLIIIFFSLWGIWALKDVAVNKTAEQVPPEWEQKMGEVAFSSLKSGYNIIEDPELQKDLEKIIEPLLKIAQNPNYKYQFHIIEDSTLNAAAFPGGHVIIHTGLILKVEKAEDLLGVLAHEIAHVNQRHSVRQLINTAGLYIALSALIGDIGALSGVVLEGGSQLLVLKNSRSHETEADEVGWDYLMQANINPRGLIDCFKIMQKEMEALTGDLPPGMDFLSTHPALENRIEGLEKKWQDQQRKEGFIQIEIDYTDFQKRLREYLNTPGREKNKPDAAKTDSKLQNNFFNCQCFEHNKEQK